MNDTEFCVCNSNDNSNHICTAPYMITSEVLVACSVEANYCNGKMMPGSVLSKLLESVELHFVSKMHQV